MPVSSTIDPSANQTQGTELLDPVHSYDDWKSQYSNDESQSFEDKLPSYIDYLRVSLFRRGELTKDTEISLQDFYVDQIIGDKEVSQEDYQILASQSTASKRTLDDDVNLVKAIGRDGNVFLNSSYEEKLKSSNTARETLLNAGEIPYASVLVDNVGVVRSGNYLDQGPDGAKRFKAEKAAIEAYKSGYLDPRDLWQVSDGLNDSGMGGLTNFQARQDDELTAALGQILSKEAEGGETPLNDAVASLIDVEGYRESQIDPEADIASRLFQEFRAKDPTQIDQIILDDLPESLDEVQDAVIDKFIQSKNLAGSPVEEQIRGRLSEQDTYSKERVRSLIKELAVRHANLQGVFEFHEDPKDDKRNLRITEMGSIIAHPTLMGQKKRFEKAVESDDRLNDEQKEALRSQREIYMQGRVKNLDELFSDFDAVSKNWEAAKASNPSGFAKEPVAFIDDFLDKKANYDSVKNKYNGVKASIADAFLGIIHSVGAVVFKSEASAQYIVNYQKDESRRRELAAIFGKPLKMGYDISTTVAPMLADISATAIATVATGYGGASYAAIKAGSTATARSTARGMMKAVTGTLLYQPTGMSAKEAAKVLVTKKLIDESGKKGATAAIKSFNEIIQNKFVINSNLFLTSANRSAGGMYGAIYGALPDDMSHEEKHDKALGHSLLAGAITGTIVSGMSAIGRGGVEDILLRNMSYGSMKNILDRIGNVKVSDGVYKEVLKKHIKKRMASITKGILPKELFRGAVNEGFEEGLDQFVNAFVEDSALDKKTPLKEKVMQAFHAAQIGAVMGASVPVLRTGKAAINKIRGASYVDPDLFRGQEVERAVSALQAAGSPLSAAELRKQFTQAARLSTKPGQVPETEQPLPTSVEPEETEEVEELSVGFKSTLIDGLRSFLKDPDKFTPPSIQPNLLSQAIKDPDLHITKGGVILGIKTPEGEWVGKEPEVETEPTTEPATEPATEPTTPEGVPGVGGTPVPVGTPLEKLTPTEVGGFGLSRTVGLQPINIDPETLATEKGVRKAMKQWTGVNGDKLNKYGITQKISVDKKKAIQSVGRAGPTTQNWTVNVIRQATDLAKTEPKNRVDKLYEIIAEELIHAMENVVVQRDYEALDKIPDSQKTEAQLRESSQFANVYEYDSYRMLKLFVEMSPEQVQKTMTTYSPWLLTQRVIRKGVKEFKHKNIEEDIKKRHAELTAVYNRFEKEKDTKPHFNLPGGRPAKDKEWNKLRDSFRIKYNMWPSQVSAEFVRQVIQLKKEGVSTETFDKTGIPLAIMSFVNKVIDYTKAMLKGAGFDPKTQKALYEHIYAVEKQMAEFWEYNLEEQLSKNKQTPQKQIETAIDEEEEVIKNRIVEDEEDDIASIIESPIVEPDLDTSIIEASRNPVSDLSTEETEQRLVDLINSAKYSSGTFGVDLQIDETPSAEKGAFWSEGENIYVNPYGLHKLVDGLRDEDANAEIESEIVRQAASVASYRNISQPEIDGIVAATSDADFEVIIQSLPVEEQQLARERLASLDAETISAEKERLVEKRMNDFGTRLLRGHTVEEDRVFFQGNPGWMATGIYFLEGMLNRVWASREVRKQNPYLTTGVHRLVGELRAMKGSYRIPSTKMAFDRNKPGATIMALRDVLDEEDQVRDTADKGKVESDAFDPETDAKYLELAKDPKKNEKALQEMVDQAAKIAGYNVGPVYHGTASEFTVFGNRGKLTKARSAMKAFFFTEDLATAKGYAQYAAEDGPVKDALEEAEKAEAKGDWNAYDKAIIKAENLGIPKAATKRRENAKVVKTYLKGDFAEFDAEGKTPQELTGERGDLDSGLESEIDKAISEGKDGVRFLNLDDAAGLYNRPSTHYAVFKPEQIKLSDPITRDENGKIIPLSQRFDQTTTNIKAKVEPDAEPYTELDAEPEETEPPFRIQNVLEVLEVPVAEVGAYKKPPSWLKWLTGSEDIRLRRLNEMRMQYYRMVNKELKEYKTIFDKHIKDTYGSYKAAPIDLIAAATGSTKGILLDDNVKDQINAEHRETIDLINKTYADSPLQRKKLIEKANDSKGSRISFEEEVKRQEILKARENALKLIGQDSEGLAEHLSELRSKVDDLSKQIGAMTGTRNPDLKGHIDNQLGIYLTRSYKIFTDENWIDDVLTKDEHRELREEVKAQYVEHKKKSIAWGIFDSKESQFADDRDAEWNRLSYTGKMQEAMLQASEKVAKLEQSLVREGKDLGTVLIEDFLNSYRKGFWDTPGSELQGRVTDILRNKKNMPKFMLKLLGEYEGDTGDFNLMRTFMNIGTLAANNAMLHNMVTLGRRGDKKDWWFMTKSELDELESTDPELFKQRISGDTKWEQVNKPDKHGRVTGIRAHDPTRTFIDDAGNNEGPLFAPPEFVEDFNNMFRFEINESDIEKAAKAIDAPLRRLTGMALGAKTLGSVPFYIRNIISNVLFFGPAQGIMPIGKMFIKGEDGRGGSFTEELIRKLGSPEKIDAYSSKLIKLGVLDNELTSSMLQALKSGKFGEENILADMNELLDKAAKEAGLPDMATASEADKAKLLKRIKEGGADIWSKTWGSSMEKLRNLSDAVDSFYKIAYFETELANMKKAREAAAPKDDIAKMSDSNLEYEAARKVKMTAQSYSQAPPIVSSMQNSTYGVLFAPYFRFKLEVPRIIFNTYKLGIEELGSGNSVLVRRGARRLSGMTGMAVGFSVLAKSLGEKLVVSILQAFGQEAEDDDLTEEQEAIIRMGSPPYLRSHTFYFFKLKGELHSLDFTYVNPFAMYADAFPRAWEHLSRGDEGEAIFAFLDTLVNVPFLDGQIALTSLMQAKNNRDAEGRDLWLDTDSAYEKLWKGGAHVFNKAYAPPTLSRLSKIFASEQATREAFTETPYGLLYGELIPFKPYKIDPSQIKYRIMKDLGGDASILNGQIRSLMTGKLLKQSEVEDIARGQVKSHKRIGETLKRVYTPLRELGVSVKDMENSMGKFMTKEQMGVLINENAMLLKSMTPAMREILEESEHQDVRERYLTFERALYKEAPSGRVYLSED